MWKITNFLPSLSIHKGWISHFVLKMCSICGILRMALKSPNLRINIVSTEIVSAIVKDNSDDYRTMRLSVLRHYQLVDCSDRTRELTSSFIVAAIVVVIATATILLSVCVVSEANEVHES